MIIYCFSNHGSTHFSEMQKQRLLNIDLIADATSADATSTDAMVTIVQVMFGTHEEDGRRNH